MVRSTSLATADEIVAAKRVIAQLTRDQRAAGLNSRALFLALGAAWTSMCVGNAMPDDEAHGWLAYFLKLSRDPNEDA